MQRKSRWYVYELIDSRDGSVFYVGKGTGKRMFQHELEAARGVCSRKTKRIKEIADAGFEIQKQQVAWFWCEVAAYDYETERIDQYGLEHLTNVIPGGSGAWSKRVEEHAARNRHKAKLDAVDTVLKLRGRLIHWLIASQGGQIEAAPPFYTGGEERTRLIRNDILRVAYNRMIPQLWNQAIACVDRRKELVSAFLPYGIALEFGAQDGG